MTISVYLNPPPNPAFLSLGGIDRVVEALAGGLPNEGVRVVNDPGQADLIANNATLLETRPGVPLVCHNHGLYWAEYEWPSWTDEANRRIVESMRHSQAITTPSRWVSEAISRGMLIDPVSIYHGVDTEEWQPGEDHGDYVLWNKAREDSVSNPTDVQELAQLMPEVQFISTFGMPTSNMRIIGPQGRHDMRSLVRGAGLYLATTRETFGIGTIEALAAGVPVVGWDYGGQSEIIIQGETGYLAPYGDYDRLSEHIRTAFADRVRLAANARSDALVRWQWADKVKQYADLYKSVVRDWREARPKVSVIVTTHNLAKYLPDCLASLRDQTMRDWEVVIVDDDSHDSPKGVVDAMADERMRYIRTRENVGLALARNIGWTKSRGKYVLFLDADDMLDRSALEILADALDHDSGIAVAYGKLDTVNEDGNGRRDNPWPQGPFDWRAQMSHLNQLPYAGLIRRQALECSGGYRERDWRAEDASLWCRLSSFGRHIAMVTDKSLLVYRFRGDSKSVKEGKEHPDRDGDWTYWFPWRTGATSGAMGEEVFYKNIRPRGGMVPFGAQGHPPGGKKAWPIPHFQDPAISVIIPVSKEHRRYLVDALDSLIGQTIRSWEAIVVDDSADASLPDRILSHPFARILHSHGTGAGRARNLGIHAARGQFVLFLDADDMLDPLALEQMLKIYVDYGGYVYCDCKAPLEPKRIDGPHDVFPAADYHQADFIASGYSDDMPGRHSVTALISTEDIRATPGFDETLAFWEDWAIYLELAVLGVEGHRIPAPLLTYRLHTGTRRQKSYEQEGALREALRKKFQPYTTGEKTMCACGSGNGGDKATNAAIAALAVLNPERSADSSDIATFVSNGLVRLRYVGEREGAVPYRGPITRKTYYAGRDPTSEFVDVDQQDAPGLMRTSEFELVDTHWIAERIA